ncbi:Sister chromatid cohesion protein 2 [Tilletia horrida]|nr:Sister chromatid cohesion protein 2 [Tilletia horrida]
MPGVSGLSSMLALQRREHLFQDDPRGASSSSSSMSRPQHSHRGDLPQNKHLKSALVQSPFAKRTSTAAQAQTKSKESQSQSERREVVRKPAPLSPDGSASDSSITSGIHALDRARPLITPTATSSIPADSSPPRLSSDAMQGHQLSSAKDGGGVRRLPQYTVQPVPRMRNLNSASAMSIVSPNSKFRVKGLSPRSALRARQQQQQQQQHNHKAHSSNSRRSTFPPPSHALKRPKKILASATSASSFYSNAPSPAPATTSSGSVQQGKERAGPFHRSSDFTFTPASRSLPLPLSPGSPDPIDAFSSPLPARHMRALQNRARQAKQPSSDLHMLAPPKRRPDPANDENENEDEDDSLPILGPTRSKGHAARLVVDEPSSPSPSNRKTQALSNVAKPALPEHAANRPRKRALPTLFDTDDEDEEPITAYKHSSNTHQQHTSSTHNHTLSPHPKRRNQQSHSERKHERLHEGAPSAARVMEEGARREASHPRKRQRHEDKESSVKESSSARQSERELPHRAIKEKQTIKRANKIDVAKASAKTQTPRSTLQTETHSHQPQQNKRRAHADAMQDDSNATEKASKTTASLVAQSREKPELKAKRKAERDQRKRQVAEAKEKEKEGGLRRVQDEAKATLAERSKTLVDEPGASKPKLQKSSANGTGEGHISSRTRKRPRKPIIESTDDEDEDEETEDNDEESSEGFDDSDDDVPILKSKMQQPPSKDGKKKKAPTASNATHPKRARKDANNDHQDSQEEGSGTEEEDCTIKQRRPRTKERWPEEEPNPVLSLLQDEEALNAIHDLKAQPRLSAGKAKGTDKRSPVRRLLDLMTEIFDGEDGLPPTANGTSGMCAESALIFRALQGHFVLRMDVLHSLVKLLKQCKDTPASALVASAAAVANTASGSGFTSADDTIMPDADGDHISSPASAPVEVEPSSIHEIDAGELGRLLRVLERTVRSADGASPFAGSNKPVASALQPKDTNSQPTSEVSSMDIDSADEAELALTKTGADNDRGNKDAHKKQNQTGGQYVELAQRIERIAAGVLASECCVEIFGVENLPSNLIVEDILSACLNALKIAVTDTIVPFVEGCADPKTASNFPLLQHFLVNLVPAPLKKGRGRAKKAKIAEFTATTAITACGNQITSVFVRTYAALGALHALFNETSIQLSESVLISSVYIALGPFFALEPDEQDAGTKSKVAGTVKDQKSASKAGNGARTAIDAVGGALAMRSLRLPALLLLRVIFARHPEQRYWIIEEVLTSLSKLAGTKKMSRQSALRSGGSVNFLSTLLAHLVQSSAHGFRDHILSKEPVPEFMTPPSPSKHTQSSTKRRSESPANRAPQTNEGKTRTQTAMWSMSMEGPLQTASTISAFVMQRVAAGKATKSSNDAAYIAILGNLMSDLLEMLFLPEWPGAAILLTRFCIAFISTLNDPQVGPEAKGIAIDHLGAAAARLASGQVQFKAQDANIGSSTSVSKPLCFIRDIVTESGELNTESLERLQTAYVRLRNSLGRITDEGRAADSARELLEAQWVAETAAAMTKLAEDREDAVDQARDDQHALEQLIDELRLEPKKVGKDLPRSDELSPQQYKELIKTSHLVLSSSAFMVQYETLQDHLLDALERQAVSNRAKALRALSSVAAIHSEILANEDVKWAVEARLEDPSVGVREAAVGLLSRYILQRPQEIEMHFDQLVHHIYDSGVSVRKRIIRLLADIYSTVTDKKLQVQCCIRLIRCVTDEDTGVQDLAVATIAKLWFEVSLRASDSKKGKLIAVTEAEELQPIKSTSKSSTGSALNRHSDVVVMVASMIRERPSPMEEVFSRMLQQCSEADAVKLREACRELSDSMIDAIVSESPTSSPNTAESDQSGENDPKSMFSRMKTIHLLVSTLPTVLTVNRGKALLPFLKSAQTDTDMQILHLLLRVFNAALPSMPRTAVAFAQELERSLMPLINRPRFKSGSTALQELVACYVKVIKLHTHNFSMMIKMFSQCYGRLQFVADHVSVAPKMQLEATNAILIALTTLLCEHADFDELRKIHAALAPSIDLLTTSSILESVYTMLVTIYQSEDPGYKAAALQSLGLLFRSYPSLMGRDDATRTMDEVLGQGDVYQRELLLRSLLEFLNGQQQTRSEEVAASKREAAKSTHNAPVDMAQLVGDTSEFAESSVSSALLQRYLHRILDASLAVRIPSLQRTALEILKITVLQGLTHPLQCVPTLIALETSADENVRSAAFHMHSHLALKHGSILAARYLEHARVSFDFQLSIKSADHMRGFRMEERPVAALQQWYSLVVEKRQMRLDFLKAMVKVFDTGRFEKACTRDDVTFARYLADNLALFDYTTNEEIMIIVGELRTILSVAGMQTYSAIDDELEEREAEVRKLSQKRKTTTEVWIEIETSRPRTRSTRPIAPPVLESSSASISHSSDMVLDKARELELARTSTILSFALILRNHLKWLYGLGETRCAKYVPGKKNSAGADKAAVRRTLPNATAAVLELSSLPGAFSSCEQTRDALLQMQAFHNAIAEEGTILEAEDDDNYD